MWRNLKNIVLCAICFASLTILLLNPETVSSGTFKGLAICSEIIIPSLFIFSVLGIFLVTSECLKGLNKILTPISRCLFGMSGDLFLVFLVSLFAGYPIGAKLINSLVENENIDEKTANTMLCYCVNAGPAFVVLAVGKKIFGSQTLGYILLISHIAASVVFALLLKKKFSESQQKKTGLKNYISDIFVKSVTDAVQSILSICAFVVLFSVVSEVSDFYNFKLLTPFLEVTTGIISTKNIYFAAFLLGFGGLSIQLQIFSLAKNFKIKKLQFFLFRLLHGAVSVIFTLIIIKVLKISLEVFSNNQSFSSAPSALSIGTSLCFVCSGIVFISALKTKKTSI